MRKLAATVVAAILTVGGVASCGSESGGGGDGASTIRVAYQDQIPGGIDPALFYSVEGDSVLLSLYQTLLTYKPGTNQLAPSLATSWSVSPDGKTYKFKLRMGVKFHDGASFDSGAVKQSFEREVNLKSGPSYMLEQVEAIQTPSPDEVVIKLKQPVSAFLHFNASMYGPKIVSPKALREHAGNDEAKSWLSENAAGTGPFELVSYKPSGPIVMRRFNGYWGQKAKPETVEITVVPNIGDQLLQLRSGQLSLIAHGVDPKQLASLEADPNLQVQQFDDAIIRPVLLLNVTKAPFDDLAARRAFVADAGIEAVARQVYGDSAEPAEGVAPAALIPPSQDPLPDPGPPVQAPTSGEITLAYTNTEDDLRHDAERMQQNLQKEGWKVNLRADSVDAQFGYASDPSSGPEAALTTLNPDAAAPAAWLDPIYHSEGGINLLGFSDPAIDKLLDKADGTANEKQALATYAQAARAAGAQYYTIPVADKHDIIIASSNLTGFSHVPTYIWTVDYADLEEK
ncbi:MAG: ABC transporter substrate-binding protein [Solirubrobacterales bacterium]